MPSLVADGALSRAANRQKLAQTHMQGLTRVPATVGAAPAGLAAVNPQALTLRPAGARAHALTSTDGGIAPRWLRIASEPRQAQARRTVDQPWRQPRDQARTA